MDVNTVLLDQRHVYGDEVIQIWSHILPSLPLLFSTECDSICPGALAVFAVER